MKRLAILLLAFAVLSSGAAYGNSFLNGLVGTWSTTVTVRVGGRAETFKGDMRVKKLKNGTYYSVGRENGVKTGEKWYRKNGTVASILYTDEGLYDGEGYGTWRVRNGRLVVDETAETLMVEEMVLNSAIRKLNRNKYALSGTGVVNGYRFRATATYVRRR